MSIIWRWESEGYTFTEFENGMVASERTMTEAQRRELVDRMARVFHQWLREHYPDKQWVRVRSVATNPTPRRTA